MLFPEPDGPTSAVVVPAGAWKEIPLSTWVSGLYWNQTSSNTTSPRTSPIGRRRASSSSSVCTRRSSWMRSSPANASVIWVPMLEIWMSGETITPT